MAEFQKKCALWMDGSLFFRGILIFFNGLAAFFGESLIGRLFSADFDKEWLRHSYFVRVAEDILNRFPKVLRLDERGGKIPPLLQGSALMQFLCEGMETPLRGGLLRWFAASFPAWGLLGVVVLAPFLPTMLVAGMLLVVFVISLLRYDFRLDLVSVPLLLFIVVSLFSGITSAAASYSVPIALLSVVMMSSYLLVRACFVGQRRIDFVIAAFVVAAGFTALIAISQVYTSYADAAWVDRDLFAALQTRVYSTFANPNVYGTYLLLAIPLSAVCVLYAKNLWYKLFAAGISGLLLMAMALTYSRGGYVSLAVAVMVFLILVEKRLIVLFAAALVALPFVLPAGIIARIASIVDFTDSSTVYRISIWQASLRMLGDFWMAGIGQGAEAYNSVYPFYAFSAVTAQHSHNLFLQIFIETGLVGILVFLGILACFFRTQFSFMRNCDDWRRRLLSAAMVSAVIAFLVQGMFDHNFHNYRVMLVFYLFLGIASVAAEEVRS